MKLTKTHERILIYRDKQQETRIA